MKLLRSSQEYVFELIGTDTTFAPTTKRKAKY